MTQEGFDFSSFQKKLQTPPSEGFDFSAFIGTPKTSDEEKAAEDLWSTLLPQRRVAVGPPIPTKPQRRPQVLEPMKNISSLVDYVLKTPGQVWRTGIDALTYTNAMVVKGFDEAMKSYQRGEDAESAGKNFAKGIWAGVKEVPGISDRTSPEMFIETPAGETIRQNVYNFLRDPSGEIPEEVRKVIQTKPGSAGETILAEVTTGLAGTAFDIWGDPMTYALGGGKAGKLVRAPVVLGVDMIKGAIRTSEAIKAMKTSRAVELMGAQWGKQMRKLYLDVGAPADTVEYYRQFLENAHDYARTTGKEAEELFNVFLKGAETVGADRDKALVYFLDALSIKKREDLVLLPRAVREPIEAMAEKLRLKGVDLYDEGLIKSLLEPDELYLPRAVEMVKGPPAPKMMKRPQRQNFKTEGEYIDADMRFRDNRLDLVEHYAHTPRSRILSNYDWIGGAGFYLKPRLHRSFPAMLEHFSKMAKLGLKESPRPAVNIFETGFGTLVSMNNRLDWHNLTMRALNESTDAIKVGPGVVPPRGWPAVTYSRFPKTMKGSLAAKLYTEESLGQLSKLSEDPLQAVNQAFAKAKAGEDVWFISPQNFEFLQRMKRVHTPKARNALFIAYMKTLNQWKKTATYLRVAFNTRNYESGMEFAFLSGVNPLDMPRLNAEAFKVLTMPESIVIGHSAADLGKLFNKYIYGKGLAAREIEYDALQTMSDKMRRGWFLDLVGIEPHLEPGVRGVIKQGGRIIKAPFRVTDKSMRKTSMWIEDTCRSITALNDIEQKEKLLGRQMSYTELEDFTRSFVRNNVNKHHVGYSELTPEVKSMKALVPFFKFPVDNQRMLFSKPLEDPYRLMNWTKYKRGAIPNVTHEELEELSHLAGPDWIRGDEFKSFPTTVTGNDGKEHPAIIKFSIDLPSETLQTFWGTEGLTQMFSPVFSIATMLTMDRTLSGKPLGTLEGERVPAPYWALPLSRTPLKTIMDFGTMISPKTGKLILGMNPQMRYLFETAFPPIRGASRAFQQEGEVHYADDEGRIQVLNATSGLLMKLVTKPEAGQAIASKANRALRTAAALAKSRPESFQTKEGLEELLDLVRKNVGLPRPSKPTEEETFVR